ncbi:MAG: hypothetical protein V3R63_08480 [Alphaproteobacteria bacterium]
MNERMCLVSTRLAGSETMSELCRHFGISRKGEFKWKGNCIFVSEVLAGEPVGLKEIDNDVWLLKYGPVVLGTIRGRAGLIKVGWRAWKRPPPRPQPT